MPSFMILLCYLTGFLPLIGLCPSFAFSPNFVLMPNYDKIYSLLL